MATQIKQQEYSERQIVIFKLANEEFGVDINEVREIIKHDQITPIPNAQSYINGVINLRGKIVVVVSLARKLGFQEKTDDKDTRVIVIEINDSTIGMVVDSATEVMRIERNHIEPAPAVITKKIDTDYIQGVAVLEQRLIILLDLVKVLGDKEQQHIEELQKVTQTA